MRSGLRRAVPADGRIFDLREADVDHRAAGALNVIDHFRQAVQGLRAEYHVDAGRAAADQFAFLRGHATADADDHRRILSFSKRQRPSMAKTFSCAFHGLSRCSAAARPPLRHFRSTRSRACCSTGRPFSMNHTRSSGSPCVLICSFSSLTCHYSVRSESCVTRHAGRVL